MKKSNKKSSHVKEIINYFIEMKEVNDISKFNFISEQEFLKILGFNFSVNVIPKDLLEFLHPNFSEEELNFLKLHSSVKNYNITVIENNLGTLTPILSYVRYFNNGNSDKVLRLHCFVPKQNNFSEQSIKLVKNVGRNLLSLLKAT